MHSHHALFSSQTFGYHLLTPPSPSHQTIHQCFNLQTPPLSLSLSICLHALCHHPSSGHHHFPWGLLLPVELLSMSSPHVTRESQSERVTPLVNCSMTSPLCRIDSSLTRPDLTRDADHHTHLSAILHS